MSELRLYARRDTLQDGDSCAWVLLDDTGRLARTGATLDNLPAARRCHLVLAADTVLLLPGELPDLPARKLAPMLANVTETASLDDAEQTHAVLLGPPSGGGRIALVRRNWLERLLDALRQRGLHPDQAVAESLLLPWRTGEWSVLVHEDGAVSRFGTHAAAALDQGDPPAGLVLALGQLPAPERIRVYQGSALKPPDLERWRSALACPVDDAGRWDWREAPWNPAANLLTGAFAASRTRHDWPALARPLVIGATLLGAIQIGGMSLDWILQTREQDRLQSEMRTLAARVLPAGAAVVDPAWQVGETLRALRGARGGGDASSLMARLARLAEVWPQEGAPIPVSISQAEQNLDLIFKAVDPPWLDRLRAAAATRGLRLSVDQVESGRTRVRIEADPAGVLQ